MDRLKEIRGRRQAASDLSQFEQFADPEAAREIKSLLDEARLPKDRKISVWISDSDALENEDAFRRRFGLGFQWNAKDRRALFKLKNRMQMTDSDIRLFRHTGSLRRSGDRITLDARKRDVLIGGVQIAILILSFGELLLSIAPHPWKSVNLYLEMIGLIIGNWLLCYLTYWTNIKPWFRQRELEHQPQKVKTSLTSPR